jgi:hypothetical protein
MTTPDEKREQHMKLLVEIDNVVMQVLKHVLAKGALSDLENYFTHALNTILENNRTIAFSLPQNFSMIAGSSLRNLLENWANLNHVVKDPSKKAKRAKAVTDTAVQYSQTLYELTQGNVAIADLYSLPHWTSGTITQRVEALGDGPLFEYELLSRFTHTDMWADINDIIADRTMFWNNLLGWGLEAANHTLFLVVQDVDLNEDLKKKVEQVSQKVQSQITNNAPNKA